MPHPQRASVPPGQRRERGSNGAGTLIVRSLVWNSQIEAVSLSAAWFTVILAVNGVFDMPKSIPNPPPGFDDLTISEQIDYVQALWERIAASPDQIPVPDWHQKIIRERLEAYRANPTAGRPWPDVRTEIEKKLRDR